MTDTTTAKHTKGPWAIGYGGQDSDDYAVIVSPHASQPIAALEPLGYTQANAKLIAAAPELLRACRKDAERIEQLCDMVNGYAIKLGMGKRVNAEDWSDLARAAIAKATK
jgi:hypothetical protein